MVHTDKIIRDKTFSYEGVFDFKELISVMREFMGRYNYDIEEKLFKTNAKGAKKTTKIKWTCDRKIDDYNKCILKLTIDLKGYKEGNVDGVPVVDGNLEIAFEGEVERDYDEAWKTSPVRKFLRALYDKYIFEAKQKSVDRKLVDMADTLEAELRKYLNS